MKTKAVICGQRVNNMEVIIYRNLDGYLYFTGFPDDETVEESLKKIVAYLDKGGSLSEYVNIYVGKIAKFPVKECIGKRIFHLMLPDNYPLVIGELPIIKKEEKEIIEVTLVHKKTKGENEYFENC